MLCPLATKEEQKALIPQVKLSWILLGCYSCLQSDVQEELCGLSSFRVGPLSESCSGFMETLCVPGCSPSGVNWLFPGTGTIGNLTGEEAVGLGGASSFGAWTLGLACSCIQLF